MLELLQAVFLGVVQGLTEFLPVWVRGPAHIDGEEIVLDMEKARVYSAFEPEHSARLLPDLAALRDFKLQDPVAFARRHGLLWHGPDQVNKGECRESLRWWSAAGKYLTMTIHLYMALEQGLDEESARPVRDFLWAYRDAGLFEGKIPDDKDELLDYASIQLAEMITRGLANCKETFVAACGLIRDGKKLGPAGDFRRIVEPSDLTGAAYKHLATMIVCKEEFRVCQGCGRWFRPDHGRQWHHTKDCGRNKRQRNFRERQKAECPPARGSNSSSMAAVETRREPTTKEYPTRLPKEFPSCFGVKQGPDQID